MRCNLTNEQKANTAEESEERDKLWYLQKSIDMFEDVVEGYVSNYEYQQKVK